ncbi:MAG: hypothetical protein AB1793_09780, partial [Candidatus Thermoplasmatota archaeon]
MSVVALLLVCSLAVVAVLLLQGLREEERTSVGNSAPVATESAAGEQVGPLAGGHSTEAEERGEASRTDQEGEAGRQVLGVPALSGLVQSESGEPLARVTLSWTRIDSATMRLAPRWECVAAPLEEDHTVYCESGPGGRFSFENNPRGDPSLGSVLWATLPGYRAAVIHFPDATTGEDPSHRIVLEEAASML